ncbi:MAG: 4-hydroxy-tetrahydrodipicolinate synthase [Elusimicrobia bacterium CG08_land_8_20_14_0_20_44_26]|nr:MAG: 4-hydroxy-tetrahydrodipicolinate synthase [Elusimicrobia bacterium CG08_land_8_20_14_0_20_44_26]
MKFSGAWTALVTPFKEDLSIDWAGFKKNVEFQIREGISGLLPMGTTGESPTLDHNEHNEVNRKTFEYAGGACPVIAGCGSNSTAESIKAVDSAYKAGVRAALLIDCYYNGPSSFELRTMHYEVIVKKFPDVNFIPYIIPGRTGCELSPCDLAILARNCPNVNAVKEATGNIERMEIEGAILPDEFSILSGDDGLTLEMMMSPRIKAKGVISVMTNVAPGAISSMCAMLIKGKYGAAEEMSKKLKPLFDVITIKTTRKVEIEGKSYTVSDKFRNPVPVKTMMNALGMPGGSSRPPLGKMTPAGILYLRSALSTVWKLSPEILKPIAEFYNVDIKSRLSDDAVWEALTAKL